MTFRFILVLLGAALALRAQQSMSVAQLKEMIRSSIELKQSDKAVASFLKNVTLTDKLDDRVIEQMQGQGIGQKTLKALDDLRDNSANLKPPTKQELAAAAPKTYKQPPPPDSVHQRELLDQMRQYASSYTQNLPNFLCAQVTRRYVGFRGEDPNRLMDTVTAKLSYNEGREDYKVYLVNDRMVNTSIDKLGGAVSTGEFGSLMKDVFDPATKADFGWDHWGRLRGRNLAVFNYFIDSGHSHFTLDYERGAQRIVTAYKGLIYADQYTGVIYQITFNAVDVPPGFPIRKAQTKLDYDFVDIGGSKYLVPLKARVLMHTADNVNTRNEEEFTLYRKFGTESNITFTPPPLDESKTTEQPPDSSEQPGKNGERTTTSTGERHQSYRPSSATCAAASAIAFRTISFASGRFASSILISLNTAPSPGRPALIGALGCISGEHRDQWRGSSGRYVLTR